MLQSFSIGEIAKNRYRSAAYSVDFSQNSREFEPGELIRILQKLGSEHYRIASICGNYERWSPPSGLIKLTAIEQLALLV